MFTIYLDMDGVICDFEKQYVSRFGQRPKEVDRDRKEFSQNWHNFVGEQLFETLEWNKGADHILSAVDFLNKTEDSVNVEFLTSTGGQLYHKEVAEQKQKWLDEHQLKYKPNFVSGRKKKGKYASKWAVLIDDTQDCIDAFNNNGGYGILHYGDEKETVNKLFNFYKKYKNERPFE